jgi:hypothetical protein
MYFLLRLDYASALLVKELFSTRTGVKCYTNILIFYGEGI